MSRRNKPKGERLVIHGVSKKEYELRNYLHLNDIYKGDDTMQGIIINSFFNQMGGDNEATWKFKINWVKENFGKFAQYAQNNWKKQDGCK